MAWTAPMTAVAGAVFTAAQFNVFVRDNLAETAPAKASTPGSFFVTSATNSIAERVVQNGFSSGSDTTSSTTYTNLDTSTGPAVTVTTGTQALVILATSAANSVAANISRMSYAISGATTSSATDSHSVAYSNTGSAGNNCANIVWESQLTPGSNTFTAQYRVAGGTGTFSSRRIVVVPF